MLRFLHMIVLRSCWISLTWTIWNRTQNVNWSTWEHESASSVTRTNIWPILQMTSYIKLKKTYKKDTHIFRNNTYTGESILSSFNSWDVGEYIHQLYFVKWCRSIEKFLLRPKYFRYLHQINTFVSAVISAVKQTKLQLSSPIIGRIGLFGCYLVIRWSTSADQ